MADMTMCAGSDDRATCPMMQSCRRYADKPDPWGQLWFATLPYDEDSETCKFYKPLKDAEL